MFEFKVDGITVAQAKESAVLRRRVRLSAVTPMAFRGFGYDLDQLPFPGLSVVPPTSLTGVCGRAVSPADLLDPVADPDPNGSCRRADDALRLLKDVVRSRLAGCGRTHVGVCLSGGLDSALILIACVELKRDGELAEVTAFHYSWPNVRELFSEYECAADLCDSIGVDFVPLDQSKITLECMLKMYRELDFPYPQTFHAQLLDAAECGAGRGVDVLMSGVGAELHFVEPTSAGEIQRALPSPGGKHWPLSCEFAPANTPGWTTHKARALRDERWYRTFFTSDQQYASRVARLYSYHMAHTSLALEHWLYVRAGCKPSLFYPYMDQRFLVFASSFRARVNLFRCGGEVYNKALLRLAMRGRAPTSVSLRSAGAPYEAVEQNYLRESWDTVVKFWQADFELVRLGVVDESRLRAELASRAGFMRNSSYNLPLMLVESWLRAHPGRVDASL